MHFDSKKINAMNDGLRELRSWAFGQLQTAYSRPAAEQNWTEADIEVSVDSNQVTDELTFTVTFPNPTRHTTLNTRSSKQITVFSDGRCDGLPAKMSRMKLQEVREQLQLG